MKTIKEFPVDGVDHPALFHRITERVTKDFVTTVRGVTGPCWLLPEKMWSNDRGHKKLRWRGHILYVHRAMYEIVYGTIPEGLVLDHGCRVHRCCNPNHLEPVTVKENTDRGLGKFTQFKKAEEAFVVS